MRKILISLLCTALLVIGGIPNTMAVAANTANITQTDSVGLGSSSDSKDNKAAIFQKNDGNTGTINQAGEKNEAEIDQDLRNGDGDPVSGSANGGGNNTATINQTDDSFQNKARINQADSSVSGSTASDNSATIDQEGGSDNEAKVEQETDHNHAEIDQHGIVTDSDAFINQKNGNGYDWARIDQTNGENNLAVIIQGDSTGGTTTGGSNGAQIEQDGTDHKAYINQTGSNNGDSSDPALIRQEGDSNLASIVQSGDGNLNTQIIQQGSPVSTNEAHIDQSGSNNENTSIEQKGDFNKASIVQQLGADGNGVGGGTSILQKDFSDSNEAAIDQSGSDNVTTAIEQDGDDNKASIVQTINAIANGITKIIQNASNGIARIVQDGGSNVDTQIIQNSDGNTASILQGGDGNGTTTITQNTGSGNLGHINQGGSGNGTTTITQDSTNGSTASILQSGNNNVSTAITQDGDSNEAAINQTGDGNQDTRIDQTGTSNLASITQAASGTLLASITQNGEGNEASITQLAGIGTNAHSAAITQGSLLGSSDFNQAVVVQGGESAGHTADITQDGPSGLGLYNNVALVSQNQDAVDGSATVVQNGTENFAIVIQGTGVDFGSYGVVAPTTDLTSPLAPVSPTDPTSLLSSPSPFTLF